MAVVDFVVDKVFVVAAVVEAAEFWFYRCLVADVGWGKTYENPKG